MAAKHEAALEVEQEVLADSFHRLEQQSVETLRKLLPGRARMRRLDLDALPGQHLEPVRRPMERVSLRHISSLVGHALAET